MAGIKNVSILRRTRRSKSGLIGRASVPMLSTSSPSPPCPAAVDVTAGADGRLFSSSAMAAATASRFPKFSAMIVIKDNSEMNEAQKLTSDREGDVSLFYFPSSFLQENQKLRALTSSGHP